MSANNNTVEALLAANRTFAETWTAPATMKQIRAAPGDPILILTCMDPRVVPEQFLAGGPRFGVFRNAGGRASPDVVRTMNVLRSLRHNSAGATIIVVHHTDCGMTHMTNESIKADAKARTTGALDAIDKIDFGCFSTNDLEKSVLEDVNALKHEELMEGVQVRGFVLSTETGLLKELET